MVRSTDEWNGVLRSAMNGMIKAIYSAIAGLLIIFGMASDTFTAAAVMCLYAGLIFLPDERECGVCVPVLCTAAAVMCCVAAMLINGSDPHETCMQCVRFSAFALPFLLKRDFIKQRIIPAVYMAVTALSVFGLAAYVLNLPIPGAVLYSAPARLQSFTGYANVTCVLCLIGVYMAADFYIKKHGAVHIFIGTANLLAAILTFSRLGFACFAVSALVYAAVKYRRARVYIVLLLAAACIAAAVIVFSGYYRNILPTSMVNRLTVWRDAMRVIALRPYGIGAGTWQALQYSVQSADYAVIQIHNSILQFALDGGIIAAAAFLAVPIYAASRCKEKSVYIPIALLTLLHAVTDMDFLFTGALLASGIFIRACAEPGYFSKAAAVAYCVTPIIFGTAVMALKPPESNAVDDIANKYMRAYAEKDVKAMLELSSQWINAAPKQEDAYTAHKDSVYALYKSDADKSAAVRLYVSGRDSQHDRTLDAVPVMLGDDAYLPLRETAEMNGYAVLWDNRKQEVLLRKGKTGIRIKARNVITDEGGTLKHKTGDIFTVGSHMMVNAGKLKDIFNITSEFDKDADIIYIKELQNGE